MQQHLNTNKTKGQSSMSSINVVLENEEGVVVASYTIKRLNVKSAIRRQSMFDLIDEKDKNIRNQMFSAASVACTLHDENGNLIYPEDKYPKLEAVDAIFDMDYEVYTAIASAHIEINPVKTLATKKKKS